MANLRARTRSRNESDKTTVIRSVNENPRISAPRMAALLELDVLKEGTFSNIRESTTV